jgi:hypothetical protein
VGWELEINAAGPPVLHPAHDGQREHDPKNDNLGEANSRTPALDATPARGSHYRRIHNKEASRISS